MGLIFGNFKSSEISENLNPKVETIGLTWQVFKNTNGFIFENLNLRKFPAVR